MNHYSTTVRLSLIIGGTTHELCETGRDFIRLRNPVDLPPCDGELVTQIDDDVYSSRVHLPHGASADGGEVAFEVRGEANATDT